MSEMIERVAKAIYAGQVGALSDGAWREYWAWHTNPLTTKSGGEWEYIRLARAAMEAMREPTEAMVSQGALQVTSMGPLSTDERSARNSYSTMIDEALK